MANNNFYIEQNGRCLRFFKRSFAEGEKTRQYELLAVVKLIADLYKKNCEKIGYFFYHETYGYLFIFSNGILILSYIYNM